MCASSWMILHHMSLRWKNKIKWHACQKNLYQTPILYKGFVWILGGHYAIKMGSPQTHTRPMLMEIRASSPHPWPCGRLFRNCKSALEKAIQSPSPMWMSAWYLIPLIHVTHSQKKKITKVKNTHTLWQSIIKNKHHPPMYSKYNVNHFSTNIEPMSVTMNELLPDEPQTVARATTTLSWFTPLECQQISWLL